MLAALAHIAPCGAAQALAQLESNCTSWDQLAAAGERGVPTVEAFVSAGAGPTGADGAAGDGACSYHCDPGSRGCG